jgi:hypothetical protein
MSEIQAPIVRLTAEELVREVKDLWEDGEVAVQVETTVSGIHFVDVSRKGQHAVIEAGPKLYGLSIVDEETVYGTGADCMFGHVPTMLKYLRRLMP